MPTTTIRTLCAAMRSDPVLMRRINGWLTIFWVVMIPVSILLGWIHSVAYVSALSLWALVSGHWSAWQAARVEVQQVRQQQEQLEHPPEERVVEAIVEQTNIERAQIPGGKPEVKFSGRIRTTTAPARRSLVQSAPAGSSDRSGRPHDARDSSPTDR
jgi:hypothetical protein